MGAVHRRMGCTQHAVPAEEGQAPTLQRPARSLPGRAHLHDLGQRQPRHHIGLLQVLQGGRGARCGRAAAHTRRRSGTPSAAAAPRRSRRRAGCARRQGSGSAAHGCSPPSARAGGSWIGSELTHHGAEEAGKGGGQLFQRRLAAAALTVISTGPAGGAKRSVGTDGAAQPIRWAIDGCGRLATSAAAGGRRQAAGGQAGRRAGGQAGRRQAAGLTPCRPPPT